MSDNDPDELDEPEGPRESTRTEIAVLKAKVRLISYLIKHDLVHKHQFEPVKMISFGFAAIVISSVLVAVLSYVLRKAAAE